MTAKPSKITQDKPKTMTEEERKILFPNGAVSLKKLKEVNKSKHKR